MKLIVGIASVVCLAISPARADKVEKAKKINMTEGLWEMSGELNMGGQKMASPATKQCLTKKDLVPNSMGNMPEGLKCKTDQKVTNSTVNWTIDCTLPDNGGTVNGVGAVTYTGKAFTGNMEFTMKAKDVGEMKGTMTMKGKYLGACKK